MTQSQAFNMIDALADDVSPPLQGTVLVRAVVGSLAIDLLDAANSPTGDVTYWRAKFVSMIADGADLYYAFAASNATPLNPASTSFADACAKLNSGAREDVLLQRDLTPIRYLMLSGTATFRMWASSPPGLADLA